MKKWTAVLLILIMMTVSLAGCSNNSSVNEDAQMFLEETQDIDTTSTDDSVISQVPSDLPAMSEDAPPLADGKAVELGEIPVVRVGVPTGVTAMSMLGAMFMDNGGKRSNIEYEIIDSPDMIVPKLSEYELEVMVLPTNLASIVYNNDLEYTLVGTSVWGTLYMVSEEQINDWSDLKGKEIHTFGKGLTPDVVLKHLLKENGLDPEQDVTIKYAKSSTEVVPAYLKGRSSIAVISEPMLSTVLARSENSSIIFDLQEEWSEATGGVNGYPQASVVVSNSLIEDHPMIVGGLIRGLERSAQWINEDPEAAAEFAEALDIGIRRNLFKSAVERSNIRFVDAESARPEIEAYLSILMESSKKLIGGDMPDDDFYYKREKR